MGNNARLIFAFFLGFLLGFLTYPLFFIKIYILPDEYSELEQYFTSASNRVWIATYYFSEDNLFSKIKANDIRIITDKGSKFKGCVYPATFHVKLYILDDVAIVGSPNFSYYGFHHNKELAVVLYPPISWFLADAFQQFWEECNVGNF